VGVFSTEQILIIHNARDGQVLWKERKKKDNLNFSKS
jgi:hypothetical protein